MIDFTYNPIISADYKSPRERTSLQSLSLGVSFIFYIILTGLEPVAELSKFGDCKEQQIWEKQSDGLFRRMFYLLSVCETKSKYVLKLPIT